MALLLRSYEDIPEAHESFYAPVKEPVAAPAILSRRTETIDRDGFKIIRPTGETAPKLHTHFHGLAGLTDEEVETFNELAWGKYALDENEQTTVILPIGSQLVPRGSRLENLNTARKIHKLAAQNPQVQARLRESAGEAGTLGHLYQFATNPPWFYAPVIEWGIDPGKPGEPKQWHFSVPKSVDEMFKAGRAVCQPLHQIQLSFGGVKGRKSYSGFSQGGALPIILATLEQDPGASCDIVMICCPYVSTENTPRPQNPTIKITSIVPGNDVVYDMFNAMAVDDKIVKGWYTGGFNKIECPGEHRVIDQIRDCSALEIMGNLYGRRAERAHRFGTHKTAAFAAA